MHSNDAFLFRHESRILHLLSDSFVRNSVQRHTRSQQNRNKNESSVHYESHHVQLQYIFPGSHVRAA